MVCFAPAGNTHTLTPTKDYTVTTVVCFALAGNTHTLIHSVRNVCCNIMRADLGRNPSLARRVYVKEHNTCDFLFFR